VTNDDRILVFMPTVKDGEKICQALSQAGLDCTVCGDMTELCREIGQGAGAALLTEEVFTEDGVGLLLEALRSQAHWSDLPLVVLAREGTGDRGSPIRESMNATLVERPVKIRSLLSVLRAALRSRRHQYKVREHLSDREQAEEARARLAAIVQSSDDAIVGKSLDGTILSWNAGAEGLFGYTPEEAIGRPITLIIPPDRQEEEREILAKLRRGERVEHFETVRVTKDNRLIDISLTISPIRGLDGRIVGASKVARDISGKKRSEEALRQSEERYRRAAAAAARAAETNAKFRTLFEQGTQFAGMLAVDGTAIELNHRYLDACGFKREDTIGRPFWECGWWNPSPALKQMVRVACAQAAAGEMFRTETPYFVADGSQRFVDLIIAPVINESGRVLFLNPTGTDVTEQKTAEANLREQTERMALLWEAASVLLTTEEPDAMMRGLFVKIAPHLGLDTYLNFTASEQGDALELKSYIGISEEIARTIRRLELGQPVDCARAQSREPITATRIQALDDPKLQPLNTLGIRAHACHVLRAGDRPLGALSFGSRTREAFRPDELEFLRTVSHYVTVAYERSRMIRELRDADRKKDDFIALLAHELRNPLAPIRNGLQVMRLAGGEADAALLRARSMMDRQLEHMVRLIDDLLDVSRINRSKMELRRTRVALADVVNAAVETVGSIIDAEGHVLRVSMPQGPVFLDADPMRLAQVFGNLLTNSAKYTARGGRIFLSAERRDNTLVVSVRDNGIGIPRGSLPNIFDMFSQVDRSIERSTGGLGIGLALVKGLVEMHGGTVSAWSEGEGRGSTFTVTLPALVEHASLAVGARPDNDLPSSRRKWRILVVDDSRDGADSLAMMLRLTGNEVSTANDGAGAIETAERFRPEVILMDVGMPRLNGLEATRHIREQEWGRDMTIIALTGYGQDRDRKRSRDAGCNGHLVKPVNLSELDNLLARAERETRSSAAQILSDDRAVR
jgi:PAS domain S-box-containing protein